MTKKCLDLFKILANFTNYYAVRTKLNNSIEYVTQIHNDLGERQALRPQGNLPNGKVPKLGRWIFLFLISTIAQDGTFLSPISKGEKRVQPDMLYTKNGALEGVNCIYSLMKGRASMNTYKLSKAIGRDNKVVKTLSDSQHRALSMLATYEIKLEANEEEVLNKDTHTYKVIKGFFDKTLPVMLHTVRLPELNLKECFAKEIDIYGLEDGVRGYLRYIDRKYGTWYEPTAPNYAA